MKLAEIILENERTKQSEKNTPLVTARLKELVYAFPNEVLRVLHKTGVQVSSLAPPPVLYHVIVHNVESNIPLRDAISKMILELDGYAQADAQTWQLAGSIASAVGTVLTGIARSQTPASPNTISADEKQNLIDQAEAEKAKGQRRMWISIGVGIVVVIAIVVGFKIYQGKKGLKTVSDIQIK